MKLMAFAAAVAGWATVAQLRPAIGAVEMAIGWGVMVLMMLMTNECQSLTVTDVAIGNCGAVDVAVDVAGDVDVAVAAAESVVVDC